MEKNKKIFSTCFEEYKKELRQLKEKSDEKNLRDTYIEARGFLYACLTFDIIETGNGENGYLNYCYQLSEIFFD